MGVYNILAAYAGGGQHCWHLDNDAVIYRQGDHQYATWSEKCCQCGRVRKVEERMVKDEDHGPHVLVRKAVRTYGDADPCNKPEPEVLCAGASAPSQTSGGQP